MAVINVALEVERLINLIRGFGWEKISEEIKEDGVEVKIKKRGEIAPAGTPG